jgi:hypothetical protein
VRLAVYGSSISQKRFDAAGHSNGCNRRRVHAQFSTGIGMEDFAMKNATYLSSQLRESAPYLDDAGWPETARLLIAAADEIESLRLPANIATRSARCIPNVAFQPDEKGAGRGIVRFCH